MLTKTPGQKVISMAQPNSSRYQNNNMLSKNPTIEIE